MFFKLKLKELTKMNLFIYSILRSTKIQLKSKKNLIY
jgi:hypothetical protein